MGSETHKRQVRRETVEVAAGVHVEVDVVTTPLGDLVKLPALHQTIDRSSVSWWGLEPVVAANRMGLSTQVPSRLLLVANTDPQLHDKYRAAVRVLDAPHRAGLGWLGWLEVSLLELLGSYDLVAEVPLEDGLGRLVDRLTGHELDRDGLRHAAAQEPPPVAPGVGALLGRLPDA